MQKCTKCGKPLTEYDVLFNKKVFEDRELEDYDCFECIMKGKPLELARNARQEKKVDGDALISLGIIELVVFALFIFTAFFVEYALGIFIFVAILLGIISLIYTNMYFSYNAIDFDLSVSLFVALFTFYLAPVFSIVFFCSIGKKRDGVEEFKDKCPEIVVETFFELESKIKKIEPSGKEVKEFEVKKSEYEELKRKTKEKYEMLGVGEVIKRINDIPVPFLKIRVSDTEEYIVLEEKSYYNKHKIMFLLKEENAKTSGLVTVNGYPLFSESQDWIKDFDDLGISSDAKTILKTSQNLSK